MRILRTLVVCLAASAAALAQRWEIGFGVGGGFYTSQDITAAAGTAAGKIQSNIAASTWVGNTPGKAWGGELRYDFQRGDLELKSGSATANFGAQTHAIHYDFLLHFAPSSSPARPFVAFGGGIKIYRGTGTESVTQPLSRIALLTKTQDVTGLVSVGVGVKVKIGKHATLRLDVHDYLTPFPKSVITPALNARVSGWIQDIVPMAGLSFH